MGTGKKVRARGARRPTSAKQGLVATRRGPEVASGLPGDGSISRVLPGKNPRMLPTPSLTSAEFEDFTDRLLSAHRFSPGLAQRVTRVERWGRPGDPQDGIDFEGNLSDGTSASWQCKRYDKLTPSDVRAAVEACTFEADLHHLVFSGEASTATRTEIAKYPNWRLLDQRGLGRMLDDLPLHKRRDVLDATWGMQKRKLLLEVSGEDAFLSLDTFAADRMRRDTVLNDLGPRVGREPELAALGKALDGDGDRPIVVLVTGPGGRGKTRLLVEALAGFQAAHTQIPVLWLSPGRTVDSAALEELPQMPAIVVVDDAHHDPAAIAPLLQYARAVDGTQLIIASRPSGVRALRAAIVNARYPPSQLVAIDVGELKISHARALVTSITDGLGVVAAAREYFAQQATHSPHVAVIAANLICRGELTASVRVDEGLREQVLARYEEFAASEVDGVPTVTVRRLLATYAALGPVADDGVRPAVAQFCQLTLVEMLRLCQSLHDRGVLVTRGGVTQVVPDVLADDLLETEAAVGPDVTGFAEELWAAFADTHAERLVASLGELDWRLTQRGGPSVFGPVWEAVRAELATADYDGLCNALGRFSALTATQPDALIEVLEEIRARLDGPADRRDGDRPTATAQPQSPDAQASDEPLARWRRPRTVDDVRHRMPELYGHCAVNAPDLLETALDALWDLRQQDTRPTNRHSAHAERVILDRLSKIGTLPDASFPARIVTWVKRRLEESSRDHDVATPLRILRPLLEKEGERHSLETPRKIVFDPFVVSATWARPIRDQIRAVLRQHASGSDLRRAAAAVDLLGEALHQPAGLFGRLVSDEEILRWESDDLATIHVLRHVADTTTSPVIRRLVRHELGWTAEHAVSIPLRHAALTLGDGARHARGRRCRGAAAPSPELRPADATWHSGTHHRRAPRGRSSASRARVRDVGRATTGSAVGADPPTCGARPRRPGRPRPTDRHLSHRV